MILRKRLTFDIQPIEYKNNSLQKCITDYKDEKFYYVYLFDKLLKINLIHPDIKAEIINGRGGIKQFFPSDFSKEEQILIESVRGITMTSFERQVSLLRSVEYIIGNKLRGSIVECGVWRGGSMALVARKLLKMNEANRKLFLFDTFEGMSEPTTLDKNVIVSEDAKKLLEEADKMQGNNVWCYSTLDEVKNNLVATGYPQDHIFYFKGMVENTLPEDSIDDIALLRLDTDWYESTKHELETLYDKLVPGGILIIDDYGHWSGAKKAVDDFFAEREIVPFMNRIDYTGRLFVKN